MCTLPWRTKYPDAGRGKKPELFSRSGNLTLSAWTKTTRHRGENIADRLQPGLRVAILAAGTFKDRAIHATVLYGVLVGYCNLTGMCTRTVGGLHWPTLPARTSGQGPALSEYAISSIGLPVGDRCRMREGRGLAGPPGHS